MSHTQAHEDLEDDPRSLTDLRGLHWLPRPSREVARSPDCWPGWSRWASWIRCPGLPWEAKEEHPKPGEHGYVRKKGKRVAFLYTGVLLVLMGKQMVVASLSGL